jgi:hypothetical protein
MASKNLKLVKDWIKEAKGNRMVVYTNSDSLSIVLKAHYPDLSVKVWKPTEFDFKKPTSKKTGLRMSYSST